MRDELFDRDYQGGRAELHGGVERLLVAMREGLVATFEALHRIEWSAPWADKANDAGRHA